MKLAKDVDNKNKLKMEDDNIQEEKSKDQIVQELDKGISKVKDLGEKAIEIGNEGIDKLDQKKQELEEKVQELRDEKEKLDELLEQKVVEPVKESVKEEKKQFISKVEENTSPENLINRLGYNLKNQNVSSPHESVKELMATKNKSHSVIDNQLHKIRAAVDDRVNEVGDRIGITRIATEEEVEHQA